MIYNNLLLNKKISNQLTNSYKTNQIQNAYIFHGQEGSGKEAHAIEFFAYINCKNPINNFSACKKCNSCIKVSSLQHELLNIILPLPRNKNINKNDSALKTLNEKQINNLTDQFKIKATDPYFKIKLDKANTILLNSIKEIKKNIHLSLPKNTFKLHLILNAEKLCHPKSEPANALLKILEEPPNNTLIILVTDRKSALLTTIISRCQEIAFPVLDLDTIRIMLEKRGVTNQHAIELAMIVDGDFHQAIDLADNNENFILEIKTLVNQVINVSESGWREFINDFSMLAYRNPTEFKFKFFLLQTWFHLAYRSRVGISNSEAVEEIRFSLSKFNEKYPKANLSEINKLLEASVESLSKNLYAPLMLTNFLISLQRLLKGKELKTVL